MDMVHFHLIVNHLPIIATFVAIPLLLLALFTRRDLGALRASVIVLTLAGVGAGAAFFSGEPAEEIVEELPGTSEEALEAHEERAELAAILAGLTAVGGIVVLVLAERKGSASAGAVAGVLAATLVSAGAMAWTGLAGGQIRHPEVRGEVQAYEVSRG